MNFHYTDLELEVGFTFDEGQKLILAPNDIAQEGIDASVTINGLYIDGALIEVDLPRAWYEKMETEIMDKRKSLMEAEGDYLYELKNSYPQTTGAKTR